MLDEMIQRQAAEFDPDQRRLQLTEIQRYILDQAYLFTPITGGSRWVFNQGRQRVLPQYRFVRVHLLVAGLAGAVAFNPDF